MVKLTRTYGTAPATSFLVSTIPALLTALADNTKTDIVVANGTYVCSGASAQLATSLWIDGRFASRTAAVTVRAETVGGVTFSGGGAGSWMGLGFNGGAHDQTWQGFHFANATPTGTGVIVFGGYPGVAAPYNITLRDIWFDNTLLTVAGNLENDHGIYFSHAVGGPHDILVDGLTVTSPAGGIDTALHFYHSDAANLNVWNVTVRNMTVTGTSQAVMLWDATLRNVVIEDSTITGARAYAIRYENGNASSAVTIQRVTSSGSGAAGFYSSAGAAPPGITFISSTLN